MAPAQLATATGILASIVSSVAIVVVNKYVVSVMGFRLMCTLTAGHMLFTHLSLATAQGLGLFEARRLPKKGIVRLGALTALSITTFNLSLMFNTVGFYQMSKLAVAPVSVAIESAFFGRRYGVNVVMALFVLCVGLAVSSVTDLELSARGLFFSVVAVLSTVYQQMAINSLQREHGCTSTQLLAQAALPSFLMVSVLGIPTDLALTGGTVVGFAWSVPVLKWIAISSLCAVAVNLSAFFVIGVTSPVTFQVTGHLKTILVLFFGFTVLGDPISERNILGIAIALVGMILYTRANMASKGNDGTAGSVSGKEAAEEAAGGAGGVAGATLGGLEAQQGGEAGDARV